MCADAELPSSPLLALKLIRRKAIDEIMAGDDLAAGSDARSGRTTPAAAAQRVATRTRRGESTNWLLPRP